MLLSMKIFFVTQNLSELASPHLPVDDLTSLDEGHRTTNHPLPSIPQGKELIIPVNGPPCHLRPTDVFTGTGT